MSERRKIFLTISLDVEEEGLFGGSYQARNVTVRNTASLIRLAPLLERGAKPTLFCAWPVFADSASRRIIAELRDRNGAEIAAHLHHWNTPPFENSTPDLLASVSTARLALPAMEAKLDALFRAGQDFQSTPLTSFRMGRWDLRREHWPLLAELGVQCDASVRPLHAIGPDHYHAPSDPYWVEVNDKRILEVPLSVTPLAGWLPGLAGKFSYGRKSLKNWGALALLPVYHPLWLMKAMTRLYLARGGRVLSLTWHSSEMMPGGTPHLPDEAAVSALMTKILAYTDWLCASHDLHFARMDELPALVGPTATRPVSANGDWTFGEVAGNSVVEWAGKSVSEAKGHVSSQATISDMVQSKVDATSCQSGPAVDAGVLPPGLPHIAYILLWYPLFTQPFIFREVEALRRHLPLTVYSLYDSNLCHCSAEMLAASGRTRRMGIRAMPRLLTSLLRETCSNPLRLVRLIGKCLCKPWPSLEIFGENLWALLCGIHLGRLLRQDGIDMIHAPWPRGTATAARVASAISGIPFSIAARGDNLAPADPDLVDKLGETSFVRANNAADKARILEICPQLAANGEHGQGQKMLDRIPLVYNSLTLPISDGDNSGQKPESSTRSVADGSRGSTVHLLALGRFDVTKGFDILLRACAILKEQDLDFSLTLAGGGGKLMGLGNLEASLLQLRESLGLRNLVKMPGLLSHNELPAILDAHDIFVAPCVIDPSGKRDGIPNTVIEAMSWGLPVVASRINALPEVVRDRETGLLVPAGDERALAKAMADLAGAPALRHELGNNARQLARSMFDPESNSRCLAAMFRSFFATQGEGSRQCAE